MTYAPDFAAFAATFDAGRSQLAWRWIDADLDTPVSVWLKLCGGEEHSFLLESVEGGATLGRYSVIGFAPDLYWRHEDGDTFTRHTGGAWEAQPGGALDSLKRTVAESRIDIMDESLPPMAGSGLFGYLGYDMVRLVEDIPDANPDELGIPAALMIRPTIMAIFDNVRHMICLVTPVRAHKDSPGAPAARAVYDEAAGRLQAVVDGLRAAPPPLPDGKAQALPLPVTPGVTPEAYRETVRRAIDYIRAGEIFQVVPAQRFSVPFHPHSFALYRALRRLNPSPFLFYLKLGDFALVGSSPEILVRVRHGTVTIRPIAGTRRRGNTAAEDKALAEDLLADPKERAEHLMLLDLARNDIGRVAETGSVNVTHRFNVEYYSHVMHIVSNVEGRLRAGIDPVDALFAGFPAGTVSGAPKIRAMQIIDELETVRRGFYGGCVGYLDGHGEIDTCIALRTGLVKDGRLYVQAGAGVVADSIPESEHEECLNKARALIRAAEMAVEKAAEQAVERAAGKKQPPARPS